MFAHFTLRPKSTATALAGALVSSTMVTVPSLVQPVMAVVVPTARRLTVMFSVYRRPAAKTLLATL